VIGNDNDAPHSTSPTFAPGFRVSVLDGLALIAGALGAWWGGNQVWWTGLVVGMAVGHFFLFCNVFRISRKPELIWATAFVILTAGTLTTNFPGWIETVVTSVLLAAILILREIKMPSYHGIG
jgi:hypothetical protein